MEGGKRVKVSEGTPQGATISPLLANVFLHHAFDLWIQRWRREPGRGEVAVVRYADDFIVGFQRRTDAERFLRDLRERLAEFSLELHPEKTRLVEFGRFARQDRQERGLGSPETFDFLGFTHACGLSKKGTFLLHRQTARSRRQRKLSEIRRELKTRRHQPIPDQGRWLGQVVGGTSITSPSPETSKSSADSAGRSSEAGTVRSRAGASGDGATGRGWKGSPESGCPLRRPDIPGPGTASTPNTEIDNP
jgi:RNA-directed DNA polymerase